MATMETKAITILPTERVYEKVSKLADKIGTSRNGFCLSALAFCLPKIEAGELVLLNGRLETREEVKA